jgi:hypothetical protein
MSIAEADKIDRAMTSTHVYFKDKDEIEAELKKFNINYEFVEFKEN